MEASRRRTLLLGSSAFVAASAALATARFTGLQGVADAAGSASDPAAPPLGGMIRSAVVEENGWVLRVEGLWPAASSFLDFQLWPDATPAVALEVQGPGHETRNGWAAPTTRARTVVATRPLRVSRAGPPLDLTSLDEQDLGGGLRAVRLALSEQVHAGEIVSAVRFLDNWRAGLAGARLPGIENRSLVPVESGRSGLRVGDGLPDRGLHFRRRALQLGLQ